MDASVVQKEATAYRATQLAEIFGVSVTAINNVPHNVRTSQFEFPILNKCWIELARSLSFMYAKMYGDPVLIFLNLGKVTDEKLF